MEIFLRKFHFDFRTNLIIGFALSVLVSIVVIIVVVFLLVAMRSTQEEVLELTSLHQLITNEQNELLTYLSGRRESTDNLSLSHQNFLAQSGAYLRLRDDSNLQLIHEEEGRLMFSLLGDQGEPGFLWRLASVRKSFEDKVKEHIAEQLPSSLLGKIREEQLLLDTFNPTSESRDEVIEQFKRISDEVIKELQTLRGREQSISTQHSLRQSVEDIFSIRIQLFDTILPAYENLLRTIQALATQLALATNQKATYLFILVLIIVIAASIIEGMIGIVSVRYATDINMQLDRKNKELTRVTRIMTHELRSPLTLIRGYAQNIKENVQGEDKEGLSLIIKLSTHLFKVIEDSLDLSKIEAGELKLSAQPFSLREAIHEVVVEFMSMAEEKGLDLIEKVDDSVGEFFTDKVRFQQIIINLVSNALKFTHEGSVTIQSRVQGPDVITEIIDTGIGIKEEHIKELFKEFSQVHMESEKYQGTGLGLSICKRLANLLGGDVTVQSLFGKGSNFTLRIPRKLTLSA